MKKIDDYIIGNRDLFDADEPGNGHFERFLEKLESQNSNKQENRKVGFRFVLKAASIAILVALSSLYIYEKLFKSEDKMITLGDISPEYKEAENYFVSVINSKYSQINSFNFDDPEQKKILFDEMKEMDSMYDSLLRDLQTNPYDERIINTMVQHYQLKIDVLNNIIEQLKQVNNIKTKGNENMDI